MNQQLSLPTEIAVETEVDGVEMGVFDDGTAYLTGRGIAKVCGVANSNIFTETKAWDAGDRSSRFAQMLIRNGIDRERLYIPITKRGNNAFAYPEDVCMAFLEYYSFEARTKVPEAAKNFRNVARAGFKLFVYRATGYAPVPPRPPHQWQKFHDRLLLNDVPVGYFSVFREMSELVLTAMQNGLVVDECTVPDISIGMTWSKHWCAEELEARFRTRIKHPHVYPDYFPQAAANAQIDAWVYPVEALGEFRLWLHRVYFPQKFPAYLDGKVKTKRVTADGAKRLRHKLSGSAMLAENR